MESTEDQEEKHEEKHWEQLFYSPCKLFEQLIKAFFNCLGFDSSSSNDPPSDPTQKEMHNTSEDYEEQSSARATGISRRPPKKPISSGPGGGQVN